MTAKDSFEKAEALFDKGDFHASIQLYSVAIELDPQNAHYFSQRGVAFFRLGKIDEALYDLNQALFIEPENPYRYSSRAFILSNLKRIDEAILDYEKAIQLDPKDAIAYNNLGLLQEKKGFDNMASTNFNKADELVGTEQSLINTNEQESIKSDQEKIKDISFWNLLTKLFTNSEMRREFIDFVKNGFRIK